MVIIRLIELTEQKAIYEYAPEGKETIGRVALDRRKKERLILKKADGYSNSYAFHALKRIEEYDRQDDFRKEDMVAWY